eukprot:TRINITY_DN9259_c0_g1_i10.p1 TRINITY_DN9259_c0_g1~~TRINITY_DN9259_c0_g1_i10.p1  ORF type:complete len:453 (+),score=68.39 TRINITY_DN9259_c0_g1_i10:464-1822(+)
MYSLLLLLHLHSLTRFWPLSYALHSKTASTVILSNDEVVSIMCYGENGTGKSHTLFGTKKEPGVIQLALEILFTTIQAAAKHERLLRVGFFAIQNECVKDLRSGEKDLELAETESGVKVKELSEVVCSSVVKGVELLGKRECSGDLVYRLVVESKEVGNMSVTISTINFIELADSSSKAELNEVIKKITKGQANEQSSIFKGSKLTQYLQETLSGNSKMALIGTASTVYTSYQKTKETLSFSRQLAKLRMSPKRNTTNSLLESFLLQFKEQLNALEKDNTKSSSKAASNDLKSHNQLILEKAILAPGKPPLNEAKENSIDNKQEAMLGRIKKRIREITKRPGTVLAERAISTFTNTAGNSFYTEPATEMEEALKSTLLLAEKNFFNELIAGYNHKLLVIFVIKLQEMREEVSALELVKKSLLSENSRLVEGNRRKDKELESAYALLEFYKHR